MEYGFGYIIIGSPYTPCSIYVRGTIGFRVWELGICQQHSSGHAIKVTTFEILQAANASRKPQTLDPKPTTFSQTVLQHQLLLIHLQLLHSFEHVLRPGVTSILGWGVNALKLYILSRQEHLSSESVPVLVYPGVGDYV